MQHLGRILGRRILSSTRSGRPERNCGWYEHGYTTNRNFECNTWLAPSEAVS